MNTNDLLFTNYLGPKAENADLLGELITKVLSAQTNWRRSYFHGDESLYPPRTEPPAALLGALDELLARSTKNVPYFHPRYAAQMLKDPAISAVLGYLTFMLSNPNNHAYEGGPVTTELEMEVTDMLLRMCGFEGGWGHLTSGGSLANLEALWAIRDHYKKPDGFVAFSAVSHYSWKRICSTLAIPNFREVPVDALLHMDMELLEKELREHECLVVIANCGSTGTGSVDNLEDILALKKKYGFHLHVDAAYGGFFRTLLLDESSSLQRAAAEKNLSPYVVRQLTAMRHADSITIDPHKQGLLPYGAGAVLYRDEALREVILNTAPYTYHLTDKPNIGMFSLEGSRPGAMAAACWLTYKTMPLNSEGVGAVLRESVLASRKFFELVAKSSILANAHIPDLDINCFYVKPGLADIGEMSRKTLKVYHALSLESAAPECILSKFVVPASIAARMLPSYANAEEADAVFLRAVFMKHWYAMNDFYYVKKILSIIEKVCNE